MQAFDRIGNPGSWIVTGGRPAACLPFDGMPSWESEDGKLVVFDSLLTWADQEGCLRLLPGLYRFAILLAYDGALTPLHHDPEAPWIWRPVQYSVRTGMCSREGSQRELEWRYGIFSTSRDAALGLPDSRAASNARADALLHEHLTPLQMLELEAWGRFPVRGASGALYHVRPGNGFERVEPVTRRVVESFCLHPEEWVPQGDVALGTMLMLEDARLEAEALAAAQATPVELSDWDDPELPAGWGEYAAEAELALL